jgi:hypothetical protein
LPEKQGPRQGHKLTPEVLDFAVHFRASDPSSPLDLAAAIREVDVVGLDITALVDSRWPVE